MSSSEPCKILFRLQIISFPFQKDIFQDITQCKDAYQAIILIDDNKPMNSGLPNRIKDSIQAVIDGTGVYSWEILRPCLAYDELKEHKYDSRRSVFGALRPR
jgi:hypothetical protein